MVCADNWVHGIEETGGLIAAREPSPEPSTRLSWLRKLGWVFTARWNWPGHWEIEQASELLKHGRFARALIAVNIVVEWASLFALESQLTTQLIWRWGFAHIIVMSSLLLVGCGWLARVAYSYYEKVCSTWVSFQQPLCSECGYIRAFSKELRCPECGSTLPPVRGRLPARWLDWKTRTAPQLIRVPHRLLACGVLIIVVGLGVLPTPPDWVGYVFAAGTIYSVYRLVHLLHLPRKASQGVVTAVSRPIAARECRYGEN